MIMRKIYFLLTLILLSGGVFAQKEKKQANKAVHKVVIQLSTPDTAAHRALTKQLNNLTSVWKDADVVVVVHNRAINMLRSATSNVAPEIKNLSGRGVKFMACEFTMQQLKITKEEMVENAFYTPYGLVEIITRQENGYAYLKGGF
jgi:intracellular sulfur oxidation DsrE/DsrF family protein